jgi:hypothetical protein
MMMCGLHKKGDGGWVMVVCESTNGQCELWGLMIDDELKDMGHFMHMKKEVY